MNEAARNGHDADVAALHLERLRHGAAALGALAVVCAFAVK